MALIEQLRRDLEQMIVNFTQQNPNMAVERSQNIYEIRNILKSNNPLKVHATLLDYANKLSTGFVSIWPFLEVNKFKNALLQVLNSSLYQENSMLKAMVSEMGVRLSHDNIIQSPSDKNILARIVRLEQSLDHQNELVVDLQSEVKRLKIENQFLTKTITQLAEKNKQLTLENQKLAEAKTKVEKEADQLKRKYEQLLEENAALKSQILTMSTVSDKPVSKSSSSNPNSENERTKTNSAIRLPLSCYAEFYKSRTTDDVKSTSSDRVLVDRKSVSLITGK